MSSPTSSPVHCPRCGGRAEYARESADHVITSYFCAANHEFGPLFALSSAERAEPEKRCRTCEFEAHLESDMPCAKCEGYSYWLAKSAGRTANQETQLDRIEKMLEALVGLSKSKEPIEPPSCQSCKHTGESFKPGGACHECSQNHEMWEPMKVVEEDQCD